MNSQFSLVDNINHANIFDSSEWQNNDNTLKYRKVDKMLST